MANFLITAIQVNLVPNPGERGEGNTNSPELSLLKILPLAYHFLSHLFWGGPQTFFTAGLFWIR